MPAGLRHWPSFRPKRAAKTARRRAPPRPAPQTQVLPVKPWQRVKSDKTVDGCRSLIHTERALRRFAPI